MRELNKYEVEVVSGAGLISDAGSALGSGIGAIVDWANGGSKPGATEAGGALGSGIGAIVEGGLSIIGGILGGLFGKKR